MLSEGPDPIKLYEAYKGTQKYMDLQRYSGLSAKIFTPDIRSYFDVDNTLVGRKLLKLLVPFKSYEWDDDIKKLELYIPILSLATLVIFSTISSGIISEDFDPRIGRKLVWILILTFIEIAIAKCSETTISNLNIEFLKLTSLVSYRFVPLALLTIILTICAGSVPYINLIGLVYLLITDTYFCRLELNNYEREMWREEGLGSKIALVIHFITTLLISWICDII